MSAKQGAAKHKLAATREESEDTAEFAKESDKLVADNTS
jgi:hypothetical protein